MNACVSVVCYKSKTLSNGENPLMLQVSKGGKRKYQSLGISINPKYWDFTRNKPKPNCPNKATTTHVGTKQRTKRIHYHHFTQ